MHELIGRYDVIFLSDDREALKAELDEIVRRYVTSHDGRKIEIWDQPEPITLQAFKLSPDEDSFDIKKIIRMNLLILLTLLIVPALNLSGMIAGRMDSRRSELGIRKSFGATRRTLLGQVLWENLFLTIIGGISGLAITWIILSTDATGIFSIIGGSSRDLQSHISIHLTPDMMFAPAVFAFAFLICVCLNLLSAVIPAWLSLRRPIVNCIK